MDVKELDIQSIIINKLGRNTYVKGRNYYGEIKLTNTVNKNSPNRVYKYSIESESFYNKHYNVTIIMDKNDLYWYTCNCPQFTGTHTCKHVAACLFHEEEDIFSYTGEPIDISKNILDYFLNNEPKKDKVVKEKINLNVELEIFDDKVFSYISVGLKKLYVVKNEKKLEDFMYAYNNNSTYKFGVNFEYDANKHYFSDEDKKILEFLFEYKKSNNTNSYYYYYIKENPFELNEREFKTLLNLLENKKFTIKNYGEINKVYDGLPSDLKLDYKDGNYELFFDNLDRYHILDDNYKYIAYNHELYIIPKNLREVLEKIKESDLTKIEFKEESLNVFKNGLLNKIKDNISISENINNIVISGKPNISLYFNLLKNKIVCDIKLDYKGNVINYFDKDEKIIRDEETEEKVLNDILKYKFIIEKNKLVLVDIDDIGEFLEEGLSNLSKEYNIYTSKKIDNMDIIKKSNIKSNFSIGQDGIMSYKFQTDNLNLNELDKIISSLKSKKKYYKLKNGNIISLNDNTELNEFSNMLDDLDINSKDLDSGEIKIPKYRAFYIDSLKRNKYKSIKTNNSFDEFIKNFNEYKNINITFDENDKNILRDYQKEGVKWLYTLYKCDLGGILADEMGLGKSLQTICFIKQILREKPDAKIMIVCPTSLVYNWKKEFDKFASNLKYVTVYESKKKRSEVLKNIDKYNIFITSYGLVRNDNDEYENINFEVCIIDEAQAIKNYQANMTKEVKKIKSRTKIALTGTPLENSVLELWSIFDFIMPGYLKNIIKFKESYGISEVDEESLKKLNDLNVQIKPFILRRKKKDVFKELPDKIENNIYLELPEIQKALYLKNLKDTQKEMDEIIATDGYKKARFKILQLLMKLRQLCIDPSILYENYKGESIKLEKLLEIIEDYKKEGHKILIFSSFKRVINNVKKILDKNKISNYVITGEVSGKDRMNLVDNFNSDDTTCFLITLKAGGTGLNLTSADVVIHLDIWWNPQVENQATDRTHRIGQKNKVTVVKLITKGTIEERILELQNKKKILSDNLIDGKDDSSIISSLTEKEIKQLLSYGEE